MGFNSNSQDGYVTSSGNAEQGEDLLVEEATSLWANSVQHTALIVDHLMGKRWLSAPAVLRWLFGPKAIGMRSADNAMECLKCTDILYNTVARVLARTQVGLHSLCVLPTHCCW